MHGRMRRIRRIRPSLISTPHRTHAHLARHASNVHPLAAGTQTHKLVRGALSGDVEGAQLLQVEVVADILQRKQPRRVDAEREQQVEPALPRVCDDRPLDLRPEELRRDGAHAAAAVRLRVAQHGVALRVAVGSVLVDACEELLPEETARGLDEDGARGVEGREDEQREEDLQQHAVQQPLRVAAAVLAKLVDHRPARAVARVVAVVQHRAVVHALREARRLVCVGLARPPGEQSREGHPSRTRGEAVRARGTFQRGKVEAPPQQLHAGRRLQPGVLGVVELGLGTPLLSERVAQLGGAVGGARRVEGIETAREDLVAIARGVIVRE
mmetsp:Transcript_57705/g.171682  ORF Transcript_57705/g.171682 Transcript_57705/m.171682 type:complete len:327 (+) Transcript_57705:119-1099(+)